MLPLTIKTCFLLLFFCVSATYGQDRKIVSVMHPGCNSCSKDTTLLYVKAMGASDTVHQIWDFTQGIPTVIFVIGSVNSTVKIHWIDTIPTDFTVYGEMKYSFAIALDKLYEYNDMDDSGQISSKCPHKEFSLDQLKWNLTNVDQSSQETMLELEAKNFRREGRKHGTINIKLDLLPYTDYAVDLPHLIHTANSTLIDVSIVNLTTSPKYNASRYSFHLTLVALDDSKDSMRKEMRKSLDDEHTPGVFEIIDIMTPESVSHGDGGFMMMRPVGYRQPQRGVAASTIAHVSDFTRSKLPSGSTLQTFYRPFPRERLLVQDLFVSFGEAGDGYYRQHNYTAWSFAVGYGVPPTEGFSLFVILVIAIGLGVPVLLALSGITFVLMRRMRAARNPPRRLID